MIPVLTEQTLECPICGEVGCERDFLYVETPAEAEDLGVRVGDAVCRECVGRSAQDGGES